MAIIDRIPGMVVEIKVNGQTLKEYVEKEEPETESSVTKYIEAKTGANFEVHYRIYQHFRYGRGHVSCRVFVDNKYMDSHVLDPADMCKSKGTGSSFTGARSVNEGSWTLQKFIFSQLKVDDTPLSTAQKDLKNKIDELGVISVQLFRVSPPGPLNKSSHLAELPDVGQIPEKALKGRALSHQASLGAPETIESLSAVHCVYLDGRDKPCATFNFKYRSLQSLKAMYIIPRSPTPAPLEGRPVEDLTREELEELLRRERERNDAAAQIKREVKRERTDDIEATIANDDDNDEVLFVEARSAKRSRVTSSDDSAIEVIDLT